MVKYKKSSAVLVFNDAGELALQLRSAEDDSFPAHWDLSAAGGIDEGEDEQLAAKRELQEELGISADVEFIVKEHHTYPAWEPSVTRETDLFIYKAYHNGPFHPDQTEVERVQFFKLDVIGKMIGANKRIHPELKLAWENGVIAQAAAS